MAKKRYELLTTGPFNLCLSSGFFGFFAHAGYLKALEEFELKPQSVSGCSAGSLVAAGIASGLTSKELIDIFLNVNKKDFWDVSFGIGLLRGEKLKKLLESHLISDFSQAKIPLHISAFNILKLRTEIITAGSVAQACLASSAVPFLFQPVKINDAYYWDGGIFDRAAAKAFAHESHVKTLFHYLEAKGPVSAFEDKKLYNQHHSSPFFLKLPQVPKSGPNQLEKGPEIIAHTFKQTLAWLKEQV